MLRADEPLSPRRATIIRALTLTSGTRLGPYEILSALGAGGMGEVYRARDPRLGRDVAIKVVLAAFAADGERVHRFEQEARAAAALNHPNILAVYDIGQHDPSTASTPSTLREPQGRPEQGRGTTGSGQAAAPYIVSELLEGDTLRERLSAGPLSVRKALDHAIQIARGLAAAHEKGIVHRDLKPENVFVTTDGRVKILDFGLARLRPTEVGPYGSVVGAELAPPTMVATNPPQLTAAGMIVGTIGYMSPEQARGLPADHRADIFAFGAVLYEMLSGRRAFQRDTGADTMIAIVRDEPPDLPMADRQIPPALQRLVSRCLEKSPAARFQSASDMAFALEALSSPDTSRSGVIADQGPDARSQGRWAHAIPWAVAAVASMALAVFAMSTASRRGTPADKTVTRSELDLPTGVELFSATGGGVAISADGRAVTFVGSLAAVRQTYLRRLDEPEASPLLRSNDIANSVFFSPDGLSLGMVSIDGGVKKISLKDGLVVTVARGADSYAGGTWRTDNQIVYAKDATLWQVPASGGTPKQLTTLDKDRHEVAHRWPVALPGNQAIVFSSYVAGIAEAAHIEAVSVPAGTRRIIADRGVPITYTPTGHLIFFRGGALLAAPFDLPRLELTGEPVRMTEGVAASSVGAPEAAISRNGSLVYATAGAAMARLVSVSRQGAEQSLTDTPGPYSNPRLAPDGRRIVVAKSPEGLWLHDMARGVSTRLTFAETNTTFPLWTPDGQRVLFQTASGLHWIAADGSGRGEAISGTSVQDFPGSVSPDGETLAFVRISSETAADIYTLSLRGDPKPRPAVKTPAFEGGPQFSPDGRWLAYASNESGQMQVYVRPYPGLAEKLQVSTLGGTQARWSKNGKELFYRDDNKMMVVDVSLNTINSSLTLSQPRLLFEQRYSFSGSVTTPNYDLSPDGQGFVMIKEAPSANRLNVVFNWFEELKARVPAK